MKNLNNIEVTASKIGTGYYHISVYEDKKLLGSFNSHDAQLYDDITEDCEDELISFESFDEIKEYCLNRALFIKSIKTRH